MIILLLIAYTSYGCTKFQNDSFQIYLTQNESIKLKYEDIFENKDYSNITIIDQSKTLIPIPPIKLLQQVGYDSTQIQALDILLQELSYEWMNKFAALIKDDQKYRISISNQINTGQNSRIPKFDKFSNDIQADFCYDLAFLSHFTIVVDCIYVEENGGMQNIFFIWNDETQAFIKSENENLMGYNPSIRRKLLAANKYLFRASLYDNNQQQYNSILEVFNQQGVLEYYLDTNTLQYLSINTQKLQIIDFRVSTVGQIAILNYDGSILVLNYSKKETQWKLLHEFQHNEVSKSFDFNFKQGIYVINFGEKILFQSLTDQFTLLLNTTVDQIFMTESLIFTLSQKEIITTFDFQLKSISQINVQNIQFILNDYTSDDIILINQFNSERYLLNQQHYLVFYSNLIYEDKQISQLIQNLQDNEKCVLQIYHSTVSTQVEKVFISELNQNVISGPIPTYPKDAKIKINDHTIYGQNLQLKFYNISNTVINLNISSKKLDEQIIKIEKDNNSLTFFSAEQIGSEYVITKQFNNSQVQLTYCVIANLTCSILDIQIELDYLRYNNSCTWSSSNTMYIAYSKTEPNQLNLFAITNKKIHSYTAQSNYQINSIQISKEVLLILSLSNCSIVAYYSSAIALTQLFEINTQTIGALGVKQWTPSGIHANKQTTKVFIRNQNDTQIIILDCSWIGFSLIDILTFDIENKVQDILIFENYFAIMIANQYIIYDMFNVEDVHQVRLLSSFGYKMDQAICYTYEGWIYMISDNKLLVYNLNKINVNSLWHIIDIFDEKYLIAFQNKLFINGNTIIELYDQFQLQSNCIFKNQIFIAQFNMTTEIKNFKQNIYLISIETIRNLNTFIQLNNNNVNTTKKLNQQYQNFCQNISDDWIKNSIVTNIEINCEDCNQAIQIKKNIRLNTSNYFETGLDFKELNQDMLIILYQKQFKILTKQSKQVIQVIKFDYQCIQILYQSSLKIILKCIIQESFYIIQWKNINNIYQVDNEILEIHSKLLKIALFGQNLFLIQKFQITLYDCQNDNFKFNECQQLINMQLSGYYLNIVEINPLYYVYYYDQKLNILLINPKSLVQKVENEKYTIDINQIINNHGFEKVNEEWLNLHIVSSKQIGDSIQQELLFISQTSVHFQILIKFSSQKIEQQEGLIIFQNYGDWIAVKSISYQNKLVIQYQKDDETILTLYKQSKQEFINQIGGIKVATNQDSNYEIMNEKDDIFLYSLDYANVTYYNKYQLNDDLQLCMNGKIENQIVEYNVSNNFSYEIVQMNIDVTYDYFTFWQIWVLVLVIVLCVGVGFYCWKKQRNQKQQKLYLLE